MTNAATEAKRAYMRKWRAENKDKVKAHQQKYWERKAAEMTATDKEAENNAAEEYVNSAGNCAAVKR